MVLFLNFIFIFILFYFIFYIFSIGFNPRWNSTFQFVVNVPELAFLYFIVKDETPRRHDPILGAYALPFTCIAPGERRFSVDDSRVESGYVVAND